MAPDEGLEAQQARIEITWKGEFLRTIARRGEVWVGYHGDQLV